MTMTDEIATLRIARQLHAAEAALDDALLRQSELLAALVETRRATAAAPFTGHDALLRLARSQQTLLEAGGDLARVHGRLSDIARERGNNQDCPPTALAPIAEARAA